MCVSVQKTFVRRIRHQLHKVLLSFCLSPTLLSTGPFIASGKSPDRPSVVVVFFAAWESFWPHAFCSLTLLEFYLLCACVLPLVIAKMCVLSAEGSKIICAAIFTCFPLEWDDFVWWLSGACEKKNAASSSWIEGNSSNAIFWTNTASAV